MAGSRANWEGMIASVKNKINDVLNTSPEEKAKKASENLGSGTAAKAANSINSYKERQRKAMEEAGVY
jgi:hypothetical protein